MKQLILMGTLAVLLTALPGRGDDKTTTFTGWFSDEGCATGRVAEGLIGPTNPECAKRCLESGKAAVFISEKEKALFKVAGYTHAKDDLGWHVEITGKLDAGSKTLAVQSVKRLEFVGAMCGRPIKKSDAKK
jgi:hypothetical protein